MKLTYLYDDQEIIVHAERNQDDVTIEIGDRAYVVSVDAVRDMTVQFHTQEQAYFAHYATMSDTARLVALNGNVYQLTKKDRRQAARQLDHAHIPQDVTAPMPGQIIEVQVSVGDEVIEGQPLVIMEAMKMEYTLRAPQDGTITAIHYEKGQQVDLGATLVDIEDKADN